MEQPAVVTGDHGGRPCVVEKLVVDLGPTPDSQPPQPERLSDPAVDLLVVVLVEESTRFEVRGDRHRTRSDLFRTETDDEKNRPGDEQHEKPYPPSGRFLRRPHRGRSASERRTRGILTESTVPSRCPQSLSPPESPARRPRSHRSGRLFRIRRLGPGALATSRPVLARRWKRL